ncbi:MAG: pyruvate carboxylase subunit B [Deltaproteobacteria bacterium]|nr:pyruvate carboxylase subunit B [Deltaproteobacteria bacterium]
MNNKIHFVDQTIRDAQQSLWGNMMRTDMIVPIAETMDQVGYRNIATVGSQAFKVAVRNLGENPWERVRQLSGLLRNTPIRGSYQIGSLSSFDLSTPREIITLWIKHSVANGMRSFWICDYQDDIEKFVYFAKIAKDLGAEVVTSLMYSISPAHTLEHWVRKTRLIAETKEFVDRIMIEDASGVITPERTRELVKTVTRNCDGIPLEFHAHCNSGLATQCYMEAIQEGVTTVHTAVAPLANGTSLPATETILKNARYLGFTSDLNEDALAAVSSHFRRIAQEEGLPMGSPVEYDLYHFEHQVPGGMISNLTRQLREVGMEDRLKEILEEIIQVRKEMGYPVMATPFSQIVGAQAMENVVSGKRYERITDEAIKYCLGLYGKPNAPVDKKLMERINQLPQTKEFRDWKPENYFKPIEEFRKEMGPDLDDGDLLLTILIPGYKREELSKKSNLVKTPSAKPKIPATPVNIIPTEFSVEVDGEQFTVKVSPLFSDESTGSNPGAASAAQISPAPIEIPEGAMISGIAGLVISIKVKVGDRVEEGDELVVIESMKMMRNYLATHGGVVKEICVRENQIINADDVLMVVV